MKIFNLFKKTNLCDSERVWKISLIFCLVEKCRHSGQAQKSVHANYHSAWNMNAFSWAIPNQVE